MVGASTQSEKGRVQQRSSCGEAPENETFKDKEIINLLKKIQGGLSGGALTIKGGFLRDAVFYFQIEKFAASDWQPVFNKAPDFRQRKL